MPPQLTVENGTHGGWTYASCAAKGKRGTMEDVVVTQDGVLAILDGHGGRECADFISTRLGPLAELPQEQWPAAFADLDDTFRDQSLPSGTTCCAMAPKEDCVEVANLGDSRAVLLRGFEVVAETVDHKPSSESERQRIAKSGGFVDHSCNGPARVCGVAVSRAFGTFKSPLKKSIKLKDPDKPHADRILSCIPDLYSWSTQPGDVLILACDGVWDVLTNEDMLELAGCDVSERVLTICEKALVRSTDNVSCIVAELGDEPFELAAHPMGEDEPEMEFGLSLPTQAAPEMEIGLSLPTRAAPEKEIGLSLPTRAAPEKEIGLSLPTRAAPEKEIGLSLPTRAAPEKEIGLSLPTRAAPEMEIALPLPSRAAPEMEIALPLPSRGGELLVSRSDGPRFNTASRDMQLDIGRDLGYGETLVEMMHGLETDLVEENLWLGTAGDACFAPFLQYARVTRVVNCCAADFERPEMPGIECFSLNWRDSEEQGKVEQKNDFKRLRAATQFIHEALEAKEVVLVHCVQGVSRSSAVVVGFLMEQRGIEMNEAVRHVKKRHPGALRPFRFQEMLRNFQYCLNKEAHERANPPANP
eukprot:TRINITY_DN8309_c0_g1_i3.p1 TRINITY_DN8309_c0_g1~~TRINITY_DN8309_c0_g1_i3.p1  ORF type:complete len:594 (-),score=96.20 TRINITY_DN8309_c0_g1_i3:145-1902(-)